MFINFRPLLDYRDYRYLFIGQLISRLGSMVTYVALPYQVYQLTHSSWHVGLMGVIELAPLLVTALLGGAYADSMNRKKLLLVSEAGLSLGCLLLILNESLRAPQLWLIYLVAGFMSALNGFHRPAFEALAPRLVNREDLPSVGALNSLKGLIGTICGPALGGVCVATFGLRWTYFIDFLSFVFSILAILMIRAPVFHGNKSSPLKGIQEGFKYACSRQELLGSYLVDFVAMIFGMPLALFPALSEKFGGAKVIGLFYAAPSVGAMFATLFSGWTKGVQRNGAAIVFAALFWGLGIIAFGFSQNLWLALFFLAFAGAADGVSGVFRMTLWNQTIPDRLRGRLAGLEMISYMSGPLLGHTEAGAMAAFMGNEFSVVSGGVLCIVGVILCGIFLPKFWNYRLLEVEPQHPSGSKV